MGCALVRDQSGGRHEHAHQHRNADTKHRPVGADAAIGIDRTNRPYGREWRKGDGHSDGDDRSGKDRTRHADETVETCRRWAGPDRPHDSQILLTSAQLASDGLDREKKRCQSGDGTEHPESERLRFD